jgi:hypothetical protein
LKAILFFLWLFILIIIPQFIFFGIVFNTLFLLSIPLIIINYNKFKKDISYNKLLQIFLIITFFHFFITLYNQYFEFGILRQLFIFPILFINFYYYLLKFKHFKPNSTLKYFFAFILLVLTINSLTILLTVISPNFTNLLYKFVYLTEKQAGGISDTKLVPRYSGFAVSGFSYLSFKYMFLYIISIMYLSKEKLTTKHSIFIIITSFIIILSLFFVARTGLLFVILFFLYFLYKNYISKFKLKEIILFFFSLFLVNKFISFYINDQFGFAMLRSFDYIFNYLDNSEFDNGTISDLSKELIFPKYYYQWLLGTGDFGRDREFITDIGWLTFINGSGLIGILFYYLPYFHILIKSWHTSYKAITLVLIFISFIANAKDLVYLEHGYIQAFCILTVLLLWKKSNQLA